MNKNETLKILVDAFVDLNKTAARDPGACSHRLWQPTYELRTWINHLIYSEFPKKPKIK